MTVKLLTSWAGEDFAFNFGQVVDLPEDIAMAQVSAGLAELVATLSDSSEATEEPKPAAETKKKK